MEYFPEDTVSMQYLESICENILPAELYADDSSVESRARIRKLTPSDIIKNKKIINFCQTGML